MKIDNIKVLSLEKYLTEKEVDVAVAEPEPEPEAEPETSEAETSEPEAEAEAEDECILEIKNLSWFIGVYGLGMFKGKPVVGGWEKVELKKWIGDIINKIKSLRINLQTQMTKANEILKKFNQNQSKIELNQQQQRQQRRELEYKRLKNTGKTKILMRNESERHKKTEERQNVEKRRLAEQTLQILQQRRPTPPSGPRKGLTRKFGGSTNA